MKSILQFEPQMFREALAQLVSDTDTSTTSNPGRIADTLLAHSHVKALDYRTVVVSGGRGSGKSFWWAALQSAEHRSWIARSSGAKLSKADNLEVVPGFGIWPAADLFPTPRVLAELANQFGGQLDDIWTAVLLNQLLDTPSNPLANLESWAERVGWVASNVEKASSLVRSLVGRFEQENKHVLIAFDALDRLAPDDWEETRRLAKSVLRFALELQGFSRLRAKVFLRPDMLDDNPIWSFPDASKLLAGKATLDWRRVDIYALLFQRLGNSEIEDVATEFRKGSDEVIRRSGGDRDHWRLNDTVWELPEALRGNEEVQREVFHEITGKAMSHKQGNVKRGYPYTWLPNHLADSHQQISPRSFLIALREAARVVPPPDSTFPVYYKGIQKGVSEASETRVREITEDYPWVRDAMEPLRGRFNVPCNKDAVLAVWSKLGNEWIPGESAGKNDKSQKLGPKNWKDKGLSGLLEDIRSLGIFSFEKGDRIQMPDVYRVAFGIGRRGGIPPKKNADAG